MINFDEILKKIDSNNDNVLFYENMSFYFYYKFLFEEDKISSAIEALNNYLKSIHARTAVSTIKELKTAFEVLNLYDKTTRLLLSYETKSTSLIKIDNLTSHIALMLSVCYNEFNENLIKYL